MLRLLCLCAVLWPVLAEEESSPVAIAISVMLMGSIGFQMLMRLAWGKKELLK